MPRFAANLTMMFNEMPFLDRFAAAAKAGFKGVEFLFPYDFPSDVVAEQLHRFGLQQVLFNTPAGNWQAGERGLACLPGREAEFEDNLETVLSYAKALNCKQIHMLAGIPPQECPPQQATETFIGNLRKTAEICRSHGITVLIEPINHGDMPGYFLRHQAQAIELLELAGQVNIALQMDIYHCQITEGHPAKLIRENFSHIGHFQIAGVPGRHEPDVGDIDYPALFDIIDDLDYAGWIGCEYHPVAQTEAGLAWAAPYAIGLNL